MNIKQIVNLDKFAISDSAFMASCQQQLDRDGVLVLPQFLLNSAVKEICREGQENQHRAYFCPQWHNVYVTEPNPEYPECHPLNRLVQSSKGCITDDQIADDSALRVLYDSKEFKTFLSQVLGEKGLYPYEDTLSSINLHYAGRGQELGWHFDNSSFAITLMIQAAAKGGVFEYVGSVRDADAEEMNFPEANRILDGEVPAVPLTMDAGALVLFRGRNALHRVTPNESDTTRMLVVLAYNSEPGISLSESSRMTFYGRLS